MNILKVLVVFGTRPEAIKMAPLVQALKADDYFDTEVCVTAQHREMLDQVLALFKIKPEFDLNLMKPGQDLFQITTAVLTGMKTVLEEAKPDIVLVHGDTTTTMATSLACFYLKIPVGHVEAGLRTFDMQYPFPEEMNRVVTDSVASLYFAPTEQSQNNLLKSGAKAENIVLTGNTVIDALFYTLKNSQPSFKIELAPAQKLILMTTHRRENFGAPLKEICNAVLELCGKHPEIKVVLPVHPNPNVKSTVEALLGNHSQIQLIQPLDYAPFCHLMNQAHIIVTDSGGIQEEAPSLGKPVLVLRDETERPEAVDMGTVKLVGPHKEKIVAEASKLLSDDTYYQSMASAHNPYGDGKACHRILEALKHH